MECLESGGHDLLDEPFLTDRAGTSAELGDDQHVEIDRGGRQESEFCDRGFRIGASEIDRLRELPPEPCEEAGERRVVALRHSSWAKRWPSNITITRWQAPPRLPAHLPAW